MAFNDLLVTEIFHSLQGETSTTGLRYAFIRLTGCNLRCSYCDTSYAFKGGKKMTLDEVLETVFTYNVKNVLLTGGEPLLQRQTLPLILKLKDKGYEVSVETHGEVSIEKVSPHARIIMDIKTPSSKMCREGFRKNFKFLKKSDEVKFVIGSEEDYFWSKKQIKDLPEIRETLFSPALAASGSPQKIKPISPQWLAEQIIKDKLNVRFQLQLHKQIWGQNTKGV